MAMAVDGLRIVPVFVKGMTNHALSETWRNWTCPTDHPIDIRFGAPVDYSDVYDKDRPHASAKAIAARTMEAISHLGEEQRAWEIESQRSAWPASPIPVRAAGAMLHRLRATIR